MDASAADKAAVRTFFINGFFKNDDIPNQPTALLEDTPINILAGAGGSTELSSVDLSGSSPANQSVEVPDKPAIELSKSSPNTAAGDGTSTGLTEGSDRPMDIDQQQTRQPPLSPASQAMNVDAPVDVPLWTPLRESGLESVAPDGSSILPAAPVNGLPPGGRGGSLLSDLAALTSSDEGDGEPAAPVVPNIKSADDSLGEPEAGRRASTRQPKPVVAFASGAVLTAAPPAKKRMCGKDEKAGREYSPVKVKQEDRYWESTEKYWHKAVSIPSLSIHLSPFTHSPSYIQHAEAKFLAPHDPGDVPDAASVIYGPPVEDTPVSQSHYGFRVLLADPIPKLSTDTVQFTLFDGDRLIPGIQYTFQPDAHSVSYFPDASVLSCTDTL